MQELFGKLGIDWRLLLSQAINFLLLITILRIFLYKPLLKILKERREKIEEGLAKAKEADTRLLEIQEVAKVKIKEAEQEGLALIREAEARAKQEEARLVEEARKKEEAIIKSAEEVAKARADEERRKIQQEAAELVKQALVKTAELSPEEIDKKLIERAVSSLRQG